MAKRMFSDEITQTDSFLDLPSTTQLLYFHLGMNADDDGFISSPKMVMRVIKAGEDDLKLLIAKKFLLPFENGVCVVKHWRINNNVRKDIYKPTKYVEQKRRLYIRQNGAYTFNPENAMAVPDGHFTIPDSTKTLITSTTRQRNVDLGKDRLDKVRIGKVSNNMTAFEFFWKEYPKKTSRKLCLDLWNKRNLDGKLDEIVAFIRKAKETDRWKKGFIKNPETFIRQESWTDDLSAYGGAQNNQTKSIGMI